MYPRVLLVAQKCIVSGNVDVVAACGSGLSGDLLRVGGDPLPVVARGASCELAI